MPMSVCSTYFKCCASADGDVMKYIYAMFPIVSYGRSQIIACSTLNPSCNSDEQAEAIDGKTDDQ
jgi:hypothetical protein